MNTCKTIVGLALLAHFTSACALDDREPTAARVQAFDLRDAPESTNVEDRRAWGVPCANPRNCAAGPATECLWGLQRYNTGLCRADPVSGPTTSCFTEQRSCSTLDPAVRHECVDRCVTAKEACDERVLADARTAIADGGTYDRDAAVEALEACQATFNDCRDACARLR